MPGLGELERQRRDGALVGRRTTSPRGGLGHVGDAGRAAGDHGGRAVVGGAQRRSGPSVPAISSSSAPS